MTNPLHKDTGENEPEGRFLVVITKRDGSIETHHNLTERQTMNVGLALDWATIKHIDVMRET